MCIVHAPHEAGSTMARLDAMTSLSLHACVSMCQTGQRAVVRVCAEVVLADVSGRSGGSHASGRRTWRLWAGVGVVWVGHGWGCMGRSLRSSGLY